MNCIEISWKFHGKVATCSGLKSVSFLGLRAQVFHIWLTESWQQVATDWSSWKCMVTWLRRLDKTSQKSVSSSLQFIYSFCSIGLFCFVILSSCALAEHLCDMYMVIIMTSGMHGWTFPQQGLRLCASRLLLFWAVDSSERTQDGAVQGSRGREQKGNRHQRCIRDRLDLRICKMPIRCEWGMMVYHHLGEYPTLWLGNNPSEYWPCALDMHGSLMRDCSSIIFYWVPGAFFAFFLAEVKDLGIDHDVMTLEMAL